MNMSFRTLGSIVSILFLVAILLQHNRHPHKEQAKTIQSCNEALALADCGEYELALVKLDEAFRADPASPRAFNDRGYVRYLQGKLSEARGDFTKAIELDPDYLEPYVNRASVFLGMEAYDLALADLNFAIRRDPNLGAALNNRGQAYVALAKYDQAIADFTRGIELEPANAILLANRGRAYNKAKEFDLALKDLNRAVVLNPNGYRPWQRRATTYLESGLLDMALEDINKAIEIEETALALYTRSQVFAAMGESAKSKDDLEKAKIIDPEVENHY